MNSNIKSALENGRLVGGEVVFTDGLGRRMKANRFGRYMAAEIMAIAEKFGDAVVAGWLAIDAAEVDSERAADVAANRAAFDQRLAATEKAPRRERDYDGDGFAAGLANCGGL
jgi:hypothetical protein